MADPSTIQFNSVDTGSGGSLGARGAIPRGGIEGGAIREGALPAPAFRWFDNAGGMSAGVDNSLPEFINEIAAPALENTKQRRMMEGFAAAREGQQLSEIAEQQPWYSKIFGPTNFEIGALTYETQTRAADMENEITQRMPDLRTKSSQEMAGIMHGMLQERMTGNAYADAILQKNFMMRAQTIMDVHTKERVAWQNTESLRMQLDARKAAITAYQTSMTALAELGDGNGPGQRKASEAAVAAKVALADVIGTVDPNQTDESVWASTRAVYQWAAQNGNAYALETLDELGLRGALPIEQQAELDAVVKAGRNQYMSNLPYDHPLIQDLVQYKTDAANGFISPAETITRAGAINQKFSAMTGWKDGILDMQDTMSAAQNSVNAQYAAAARQAAELAKAKEKAADEAEARRIADAELMMHRDTLRTGSMGRAIRDKTATQPDFEQVMMAEYQANPEAALHIATRQFADPQGRAVSQDLKELLQRDVPVVPDADWSPTVDASVARLNAVRNAPLPTRAGAPDTNSGNVAAFEYFGSERIRLLDAYTQARTVMDAPAAWKVAQQRVAQTAVGRGNLSQESYKTLVKVARDLSPPWYRRALGAEKFQYRGPLVQSAVDTWDEVKRTFQDLPDEKIAEVALSRAQARDTDVAGQFSWHRKETQKPIGSYGYGVPAERYGKELWTYMRERLKTAHVDADDIGNNMVTVRMADTNGHPNLAIWAADADGKHISIVFGKKEFDEVQRRSVEQDTRAKQESRAVLPSGYVPGQRGNLY